MEEYRKYCTYSKTISNGRIQNSAHILKQSAMEEYKIVHIF